MTEETHSPSIVSTTDPQVTSNASNWPLMISGAFIIILLLAVGYLFLENNKLERQSSFQPQPNETGQVRQENTPSNKTESTQKNVSAQTVGDFTLVNAFARVLLSDCTEAGISAEKLPLNLTALLPKYNHSGPLSCSLTSSYVSLSGGSRPDFQTSSVYIFHGGSSYEGYGNPFRELATYSQVIIDDKHYAFELMDPGPYGISDIGLYITLVGQTEPQNGNLLVRSTRLVIMEDEKSLNLVRQYGEQVEKLDEGAPSYVVHDNAQISKLTNAIIQEIETEGTNFNQVFSAAAADIEDDFKLISPAL